MDKDVKCPMTNVLPGSLTVNNLQPPVSNRGLLGLVDELVAKGSANCKYEISSSIFSYHNIIDT